MINFRGSDTRIFISEKDTQNEILVITSKDIDKIQLFIKVQTKSQILKLWEINCKLINFVFLKTLLWQL